MTWTVPWRARWVDLETGLSLASKIAPGGILNPVAMEAMSAAGADYFRGKGRAPSGGSDVDPRRIRIEFRYGNPNDDRGHLPLHVGGSGDRRTRS